MAFLVSGIIIGWKIGNPDAWTIAFASVILASALGVATFKTHTRMSYQLPKAHTDFQKVYFESEHSDIALPDVKPIENYPNKYHTFYVWTQRVGYVPSLERKLETALEKGKLVVIINPNKSFTEGEIQQTINYVERGGSLLILDGPQNERTTSNQLLEPFNMQFQLFELRESGIYWSNKKVATAKRISTVAGGQALLTADNRQPVFSIARRGKGIVAATSLSYMFNDNQMGNTTVLLNQEQKQINNLEFWMLRNLVERKR
jgi:hypothetical protein